MGSSNHPDDHNDDDRRFEDRRGTYNRDEDRAWAAEDARRRDREIGIKVSGALARGDWEAALKAQGNWCDFLAAREAGAFSGGPASGPSRASGSGLSSAIQEASRELDVVSSYFSVEATYWIRHFLANISPEECAESRWRKSAQILQVAGQLKAREQIILDLLSEKLRTVAHELTSRS